MKPLPLALFGLLGIVWGSSFIFMKTASAHISPLQIVLLRVLFGFLPIALFAFYQRSLSWRHFRHIGHFLVMAAIGTIGYYYGFAKGASLLLSGVAGALSGLTPILSFLLAIVVLRTERATVGRAIGVSMGFLGVLTIARPTGGAVDAAMLEGIMFNVVGSLSVGASFVYAKKYILPLEIPVSAVIAYQLGLSLIILLAVTDLTGIGAIWGDIHAAAGLAIGLGVVGTGLAFILYYYIIDHLGAVAASSVAYIPPVVALVIGALLVGEKIEPLDYLGAAVILVGIGLVNRKA